MTDEPDADDPRDPFLDDEAPVWDYVFRKGAMVFTALAELDTVFDVMRALKDMPESDLKSMILERLYVWHAAKGDLPLRPLEWLRPPEPDS